MRLLRLCKSSRNIRFPTILFFRIQRCNSFPFQPRSHLGPLISSFGCFSKFPRIPMLSYTPNMALFSFQRSTIFGGGSVSLTRDNSGTPPLYFRSASRKFRCAKPLREVPSRCLGHPKTGISKFSFLPCWRFLNCEGDEGSEPGIRNLTVFKPSLCLTSLALQLFSLTPFYRGRGD